MSIQGYSDFREEDLVGVVPGRSMYVVFVASGLGANFLFFLLPGAAASAFPCPHGETVAPTELTAAWLRAKIASWNILLEERLIALEVDQVLCRAGETSLDLVRYFNGADEEPTGIERMTHVYFHAVEL